MVSGVDYRLVDAAGNDLPFDGVSQGEVLLRGPWIIESYAKLANGADRFLDGYWRSGDVGVIDKHGYLKITDRLKDVIKSGGEGISSIDMENAIASHPGSARPRSSASSTPPGKNAPSSSPSPTTAPKSRSPRSTPFCRPSPSGSYPTRSSMSTRSRGPAST